MDLHEQLLRAAGHHRDGSVGGARVGSGVFEYRIDFGPGYRVYFGKDGDMLVILVGGGTKKKTG